jgi:predicted GNAT family acetyltransferase
VEIAGVATLPADRRRGLGAAVTATLARHALDTGADLVFLSAGSEQIARVYLRTGFRRIGTACVAEPAPVTP